MKVRLKVSVAGPTVSWRPGQVVELPEPVAVEWIRIGHAEPAPEGPETATAPAPPEKAVRPAARKRKKEAR